MAHKAGKFTFTDAEWEHLLETRRADEELMLKERGQEWMDQHRVMLDSQWEHMLALGLFTLE